MEDAAISERLTIHALLVVTRIPSVIELRVTYEEFTMLIWMLSGVLRV
jgi:hypothetical protein